MRRTLATVLIGLTLLTADALTQAPQDKFFDSNGTRLRYVEAGSGTPVLLVHGYTRSVDSNWIATGVFANLVKDYRVVAYDLPGHGKSGKAYEPSAYGDMAGDPIRLMDHLGIKRAHLLGYSLGGAVVARAAVQHPERLITAMLGGHSGLREWGAEHGKFYEENAQELASDVPFRSLLSGAVLGTKLSEDEIRARSEALAAENDVKALAALRRGGMKGLYNSRGEAAAIKVPLLMVYGSLDSVAVGRTMLEILPAARMVVIEGATHAGDRSAARHPEFVDAVRRFMTDHR